MHIGFYSWTRLFNRNRLLSNVSTADWGADNSNCPIALLVAKLRDAGHHVSTIDTQPLDYYDRVVFLDYPEQRTGGQPNGYLRALLAKGMRELYLLCIETPAVKPNNWIREKHSCFKRIFTWHDDWVDGERYLRVHSTSHKRSERVFTDDGQRKGLLVLSARQKFSDAPSELYSERLRAIRWFESNQPADFTLLGAGWDRHYFRGALGGLNLIDHYVRRVSELFAEDSAARAVVAKAAVINRLASLAKNGFRPAFPSWRGPVTSIRWALRGYRFSLCFENSRYPGWITERLFDSFLAGCVPVYLGDPNIGRRVPAECFIDMREFDSYAGLHKHLRSMPDARRKKYIGDIADFLASPAADIFTAEHYAETVCRELLDIVPRTS